MVRASRRGASGFTLIELMITVAILAILAAVAIPRYIAYTFRARQAEVYSMLAIAKNQQYAYFASYDCFAPTEVQPLGVPGVTPRPYTSVSNIVLPCDGTQKAMVDVGIKPATAQLYYSYQCDAQISRLSGGLGPDNFVCAAVGDLDGDGTISEFVYCTDQASSGTGLPSPITGTACSFPYDPVRVSSAMF